MLAVLVNVINVIQRWRGLGSVHKRRHALAEASHTHDAGYPFSFDNICEEKSSI